MRVFHGANVVIKEPKIINQLSGKEVIDLFDKHDIWELAGKSCFLWHIESPEYFV